MSKSKSQFCHGLGWPFKIEWFDLTGVTRLKNGLLAQLDLESFGTQGHYPGFRVKVINPSVGVVGEKYFLFDDYLNTIDRSDNRPDYKPSGYTYHVLAVGRSDWDWYIAKPKSTVDFCSAIEQYILMFV